MNDILNMQPGRELDAMIAEKVFQWRRIQGPKFDYDGPCESGDVLIPPTVLSEEEAYRMMPPRGSIPFYYFVNRKYSTDTAAAWEVVERMKELNWWFVLSSEVESWTAMFYWDLTQTEFEAKETTAPEAIVKAALLALEGNRGD